MAEFKPGIGDNQNENIIWDQLRNPSGSEKSFLKIKKNGQDVTLEVKTIRWYNFVSRFKRYFGRGNWNPETILHYLSQATDQQYLANGKQLLSKSCRNESLKEKVKALTVKALTTLPGNSSKNGLPAIPTIDAGYAAPQTQSRQEWGSAIETRDRAQVERLIEQKAAVDSKTVWSLCITFRELVPSLIKHYPDDVKNVFAHIAEQDVKNEHMDLFKELIEGGADINAHLQNKNTLLILAAKQKQTELVGLLLDKNADAAIEGENNTFVLMFLLSLGQEDLLEKAISQGASFSAIARNGCPTVLQYVVRTTTSPELVRFVVEKALQNGEEFTNAWSSLVNACKDDEPTRMRMRRFAFNILLYCPKNSQTLAITRAMVEPLVSTAKDGTKENIRSNALLATISLFEKSVNFEASTFVENLFASFDEPYFSLLFDNMVRLLDDDQLQRVKPAIKEKMQQFPTGTSVLKHDVLDRMEAMRTHALRADKVPARRAAYTIEEPKKEDLSSLQSVLTGWRKKIKDLKHAARSVLVAPIEGVLSKARDSKNVLEALEKDMQDFSAGYISTGSVMVARDESQTAQSIAMIEDEQDAIYVSWIATNPDNLDLTREEAAVRGAGYALLQNIAKKANDQGKSVKLMSSATARDFYLKMGFEPEGEKYLILSGPALEKLATGA